ncbi:hypothetical protein D3C85_16080 [compost metagenome]
MKNVIMVLLLSMCALVAHATQLDYTIHYRTAGVSFPDEMSPRGLPAAIPCSISKDFTVTTVTCTWVKMMRNLNWVDQQTGQKMFSANRSVGICRRGTCQSNGEYQGNISFDTNFIVSIWYYIGESTDGKIVAYLKDHGPLFNQPAISYVEAGRILEEFYAISGASDEVIKTTMDWRYEGGWEQFQADLGNGSAQPAVSTSGIKEAWCNPRMDDDCSIDGKSVLMADLGKYLPVVNAAEVETAGGTCEYPICYDKGYKPIGIRDDY